MGEGGAALRRLIAPDTASLRFHLPGGWVGREGGGTGGVGGSGGSGVTQDISVVSPPSEEEGKKKHKGQGRRRSETLMRTRASARLEAGFFFLLSVFSIRFQVFPAGGRNHEINKEMNKSGRRVS